MQNLCSNLVKTTHSYMLDPDVRVGKVRKARGQIKAPVLARSKIPHHPSPRRPFSSTRTASKHSQTPLLSLSVSLSICPSSLPLGISCRKAILHFSAITPSYKAIMSDRSPVGLDAVYALQHGDSSSRTRPDKGWGGEGGAFSFFMCDAALEAWRPP